MLPDVLALRAATLASVGRFAEAERAATETAALARRHGVRLIERWSALVRGRALCSQGDGEAATAAVESVLGELPPLYRGMAHAVLVVAALQRGGAAEAQRLVARYDAGRGDEPPDSDFRCLRAAVLACARGDRAALARVLPEAAAADFAEWGGWVPAVVDLLLDDAAGDGDERAARLAAAHAALDDPDDPARQTAPIRAQALRLAAWLAWDRDPAAARELWRQAGAQAAGCGMRHAEAQLAGELRAHSGAATARPAGGQEARPAGGQANASTARPS